MNTNNPGDRTMTTQTVRYTKIADHTFNALFGRDLLGEIHRIEGTEPAKREGKVRKTTTFCFFPAGTDDSEPTLKATTMAALKAEIAKTLPAEEAAKDEPGTTTPMTHVERLETDTNDLN